MFGFLKIFKRKPVEMPEQEQDETYLDALEAVAGPPPVRQPVPQPVRPQRPPARYAAKRPRRSIALQTILSGLPLELQPRVRQLDVGDMTIAPLEKILSQLSRGSVKTLANFAWPPLKCSLRQTIVTA